MKRAHRRMLFLVGWVGAAYAAAVGVARATARRFLYPAPQADLAPLPPGATTATWGPTFE